MNATMKAAIIGALLIAVLFAVPVAALTQTATGTQSGAVNSINVASNTNVGNGAVDQVAIASQDTVSYSGNGAFNYNKGNGNIEQNAEAQQDGITVTTVTGHGCHKVTTTSYTTTNAINLASNTNSGNTDRKSMIFQGASAVQTSSSNSEQDITNVNTGNEFSRLF